MRLPQLKFLAIVAVGVLMPFAASKATAQHTDIVLGESEGKIIYEHSPLGRVFSGTFGVAAQTTANPGFATDSGGGFVMPGSTVVDYNVLDYNGLGLLAYHNGTDFAPVPAAASITINDTPAGTLVVDAATVGPATGPRYISQASSSGSIHKHLIFDLNPPSLDIPEYGAYGMLMEFSTYSDSPVSLANSDPFYLVFNFGLEESQFNQALGDFAVRVPEPASLTLVGLAAVAVGGFGRRRRC